ncbi:DUF4041 domain-containing protein [Microbulbifer sp. ANSA003]|uniref:DUF4041 domain-containing protein n=1 Tax=unclassified Microbulbifer TaxID=2619833 RepID=UPI0040391DFB
MEVKFIIALLIVIVFSVVITYFFVRQRENRKILEYRTVEEALKSAKEDLSLIGREMTDSRLKIEKADAELARINADTKKLQVLKQNSEKINSQLVKGKEALERRKLSLHKLTQLISHKESELHKLVSKIDIYNRIDEFVDSGHYETPEYLFETSARFSEEIKRIRSSQKEMIKQKTAITYPDSVVVSDNKSHNKKIMDGQVKLMLVAFNIECDSIIGKVKPSTYSRTLERIENLAGNLEKSAATLRCGFNLKYIESKYEECKIQYQYTIKKQEEVEEQRLIREQIREEQKAIKEYEKAVAQAEKEEKMYRDMLVRAREELDKVSAEERILAEKRIEELERQLAEAEAKEERAKSMAEQTRKGHVYVISNIGSFGKDVYKIGLTRRLEPMDRVKELGDASVPFSFDVHAMIYVDDAPALEAALHKEFTRVRVNAVNLRKEFFRIDLQSIKKAVNRIAGTEAEFKMTAAAEDYYETRRLQTADTQVA